MAALHPTPLIQNTMRACGSCVHWEEGNNGYGYCQPAKAFSHWPARPSESGARLKTRIDFGCVMHESPPREEGD